MIKIALVEDELEARKRVEEYLLRFSQEEKLEYSLEFFEDATSFLEKFQNQYNVILLDIELPSMDGMTCAYKIRERDMDVTIVFVTNMAQYAVKGYEVDASDFIVKPVSYYDFALKLRRVLNKIKNKDEYVVISTNMGEKSLAVKNLYYVELVDRNLVYHTSEGEFIVHKTLRDVENELLVFMTLMSKLVFNESWTTLIFCCVAG